MRFAVLAIELAERLAELDDLGVANLHRVLERDDGKRLEARTRHAEFSVSISAVFRQEGHAPRKWPAAGQIALSRLKLRHNLILVPATMIDGPALPSASGATRALGKFTRTQRMVLPAELVTTILEYLPFTELWTAARVSRQFYGAAWQAGLFIHRQIELESGNCASQLAVFEAVLEHALRKD
ncbi:hypothetical protein AURDEDRAFT_163705 [Auricularia subglabra TFB-10046 SS5]|nr:hypothetical protein AURDEDRAFT_163705 [Auricularia subglabra TFB-10046 SS5]